MRLQAIGAKARNATYIFENEAGKISREVAKVVERRAVKSTHCNERSSRSHCMVGTSSHLQGAYSMMFLKDQKPHFGFAFVLPV